VKLLFDANLSPALVVRLHSEYPEARTCETSAFVQVRMLTSGRTRRRRASRSFPRTPTSVSEASLRGSRRKSCGLMSETRARPRSRHCFTRSERGL